MGQLTPSTLRVHLVQRLRDAILSGKYKPGDRLNESSIAREFSVSRIPVREALLELRESGLVMSHERRGMFVTSLSEDDIQKVNDVRTVLETEALTLARAHMKPGLAVTLSKMVDKMESAVCNLSEAVNLDFEFHRTIWTASGNDYLKQLLDPITTLLFAQYTLERLSSEHRRWRLDHHRALLEALVGRHEVDLRAAFLNHLQAGYTEVEQVRKPRVPKKVPEKRVSSKIARRTMLSEKNNQTYGSGTDNRGFQADGAWSKKSNRQKSV